MSVIYLEEEKRKTNKKLKEKGGERKKTQREKNVGERVARTSHRGDLKAGIDGKGGRGNTLAKNREIGWFSHL